MRVEAIGLGAGTYAGAVNSEHVPPLSSTWSVVGSGYGGRGQVIMSCHTGNLQNLKSYRLLPPNPDSTASTVLPLPLNSSSNVFFVLPNHQAGGSGSTCKPLLSAICELEASRCPARRRSGFLADSTRFYLLVQIPSACFHFCTTQQQHSTTPRLCHASPIETARL